jgi:hypothetical protein
MLTTQVAVCQCLALIFFAIRGSLSWAVIAGSRNSKSIEGKQLADSSALRVAKNRRRVTNMELQLHAWLVHQLGNAAVLMRTLRISATRWPRCPVAFCLKLW